MTAAVAGTDLGWMKHPGDRDRYGRLRRAPLRSPTWLLGYVMSTVLSHGMKTTAATTAR